MAHAACVTCGLQWRVAVLEMRDAPLEATDFFGTFGSPLV